MNFRKFTKLPVLLTVTARFTSLLSSSFFNFSSGDLLLLFGSQMTSLSHLLSCLYHDSVLGEASRVGLCARHQTRMRLSECAGARGCQCACVQPSLKAFKRERERGSGILQWHHYPWCHFCRVTLAHGIVFGELTLSLQRVRNWQSGDRLHLQIERRQTWKQITN